MPSADREESRDRELVLKHQSSFSDSGRASVPMWDSSDPDRAPPPLPLNPGSTSPAAKSNVSKNVAAAAEALTAKARESAYTINPLPLKSPEKSLFKDQQHKRLQSLQNGTLRDRNSWTDALSSLNRSPERSPERLPRAIGFEHNNKSPERSPTRSRSSSIGTRDGARESSTSRSTRPSLKPILGENTPPSSTMLALQNMSTSKENDSSLADITNASTPTYRNPQSFDAISTQILSLTTIATNLQREMAQLSRRSKDNATDLISLKEATNSRDEDIRKSLKDLASSIAKKIIDPPPESNAGAHNTYRSPGALLLDNKAYASPSGMPKGASYSRTATPSIFGESELSTSSYSIEGAASIALLEKIWRDMGTKEGQGQMRTLINELKESSKTKAPDSAISKKLEEILTLIKEKSKEESSYSRALVPRRDNGNRVVSVTQSQALGADPRGTSSANASKELTSRRDSSKAPHIKAADFINDDLQKLLKKMKDSITEGGGMTAEVKAHVRELRGEVLGMGRDIARKLDQAETASKGRGDPQGPTREEIAAIVEDGLGELRDQMETLIRERRRQSSSSISSRRSIDGQEVYAAVKNALVEFPAQQLATQQPNSGIEREEILEAVREAWETYKPEIELQNFGLERDEILSCLKEGLQQYQPPEQDRELGGATYDDVLDAVREGLQHFQPPAPLESDSSLTREEILMAVRECLDNYEFPSAHSALSREVEITREDVLDAVREGLSSQAPISREIEFNRDDLFDAVKAGLEGVPTPMGGVGEKVMDKMEELIDDMRVEFKQYSVANGGDTEQVLDALKDGLESLRADIEAYVDRASDVTGKDEIIHTIQGGLENLRDDLEGSMTKNSQSSDPANNNVLLDAMEKEFEHLRQTIATSLVRSGGAAPEREELLDIIREGLEGRGMEASRNLQPETDSNTVSVMREEFEHLRETLATTMMRAGDPSEKEDILEAVREIHESLRGGVASRPERPESVLSASSELLDVFHEGLDNLRTDIERIVNKPLDMTVNYEILETLKEGLANVRADVDRLNTSSSSQRGIRDGEVVIADENVAGAYKGDISNLEMMITQLRIKVEALDNMPQPPPADMHVSTATTERIEGLEGMLRDMQTSIERIGHRERAEGDGIAMKEDVEALETLLRNTKAKLDEFGSSDADALARVSHVDSLEAVINDFRDELHDLNTDTASKKDFSVLEALLKEVRAGLEELQDRGPGSGEKVSKTDIEALETLCMDTKTQIGELPLPDPDTLPTKSDVETLAEMVRGFNDTVAEGHALSAQAFEARKTEHGGIADKIEDVKLIFEDVREELKARIEDGHSSIKDVAETLETITESISAADATASVEDLRNLVKKEFESLHDITESAKVYHESNHSILLDKHSEHRQAIISDFNGKLDSRFDELMTKYDDAQLAAQEKERSLDGKEADQAASLSTMKSVVDDLRILVDTLGATVTESCDKINDDSKTVFNRVEEVRSKVDELLAGDGKVEHQVTRAEISKVLVCVEGIQAHSSEYSPKILEAVQEVLNIVGQHYEQTKSSTEEIMTSVQAIPGAIPLPAIASSNAQPEPLREASVAEQYDDSHVHTKLDQLIANATETASTAAQLALMEQIRDQVNATSAKMNDFVNAQQIIAAEEKEYKAKEAEEAAIALEKRNAQKSIVEADIVRLSGQKDGLGGEVQSLLQQKEELAATKSRMQADLSSLETALQIRREELQVMEARADGLERRILDGILDHSRSLLSTSRPPSSLKEMNLKRVTSNGSNATTTTRRTSAATAMPSASASAVSSGVGLALKRRQPARTSAIDSKSSTPDRRILSLSTLGGNKGAPGDRTMVLANPGLGGNGAAKGNALGPGPMKRSHSVKSNFPSRKSSWGGTKTIGMYADEAIDETEDKENSILDDVDEEDGDGSQTGTERRTSFTGTDRQTSYSGTYTGTGSYGEGSIMSSVNDENKRDSYDASTIGTIGTRDFAFTDDGRSEFDHGEDALPTVGGEDAKGALNVEHNGFSEAFGPKGEKGEVGNSGEMILYGHQSDSGIGTDIPTAQLPSQSSGSDYFKHEGSVRSQ